MSALLSARVAALAASGSPLRVDLGHPFNAQPPPHRIEAPSIATTVPSLLQLRGVEVGPFRAAYHRAIAGPAFRDALGACLARMIMPQLTHPPLAIAGKLVNEHDEDRHTGLHSAVRHQYTLHLELHQRDGRETLTHVVRYEAGAFTPSTRTPVVLWTVARQTAYQRPLEVARSVLHRAQIRARRGGTFDERGPACPTCSSPLIVHMSLERAYVVCPLRCVRVATGGFWASQRERLWDEALRCHLPPDVCGRWCAYLKPGACWSVFHEEDWALTLGGPRCCG